MQPKIDVVIPAYCYGRYLRQCVASVLEQGVPGLRVLIIDDASTDDTPTIGAALASADARISFRRHAANQGHIATFNEGVAWVEADYMLLLSADDFLLPGALGRAVALLDAHPEVGLCIGHARIQLADGGSRAARILPERAHAGDLVVSGREFVEELVRANANNIVVAATAVVRSALLRRLGGYREDMPHTGDLDLWLRLSAHGAVGIVAAEQAVYRRHAANMSSGYARDYGIADMQQRKDAYDVFRIQQESVMPGVRTLHRHLLRALAREAVGQASAAYSDGAAPSVQRLLAFALDTSPGVWFSAARFRFACKQLLGARRSRALSNALNRRASPLQGVAPTREQP